MCVYIRQFCITAIIILFIENISCIIISSLLFGKIPYILAPGLDIAYLSAHILVNLLSIMGTYVFGLRMIYFKMNQYYRHYISFLISFFFLTIAILIVSFLKGFDLNKDGDIFKLILLVFDGLMAITYGINIYITNSYKDVLKNQISDSLLNRASNPDSIDNDIYNNIIEQSLNPDDESLKDEYVKIKNRSAKKINHSSDL